MIVTRALYGLQRRLREAFQTSDGGAGAGHFVRDTPLLPGTTFYFIFRVSGGGPVLESDCVAVVVK
jgi:hypothetical protein